MTYKDCVDAFGLWLLAQDEREYCFSIWKERTLHYRGHACYSHFDTTSTKPMLLIGVDGAKSRRESLLPCLEWLGNDSPYKAAFLSPFITDRTLVAMDVEQDAWLVHQAASMLRIPREHPGIVERFSQYVDYKIQPDLAFLLACFIEDDELMHSPVGHAAISFSSASGAKGFINNNPREKGTTWKEASSYSGHGMMWEEKAGLGPSFYKLLKDCKGFKTKTRKGDFGGQEEYISVTPYSIKSDEIIKKLGELK